MRPRHVGALLDAAVHQHQLAGLTVDPHERAAAALGREMALGDPAAAPLLADEADEGRRDEESADAAHGVVHSSRPVPHCARGRPIYLVIDDTPS